MALPNILEQFKHLASLYNEEHGCAANGPNPLPDLPNDSSTGPQQKIIWDKRLFVYLSTTILQYLEILGLKESYSTFQKECQETGYPLPPSLSTLKCVMGEGLALKDIDTVLKHFDDENGTALLKKWDSAISTSACGQTEKQFEILKLSVHIRIYVYVVLPFRKNVPGKKKEFFHEDASEEEILSLYALPFVSSPASHPIFSKFFVVQLMANTKHFEFLTLQRIGKSLLQSQAISSDKFRRITKRLLLIGTISLKQTFLALLRDGYHQCLLLKTISQVRTGMLKICFPVYEVAEFLETQVTGPNGSGEK